jgi:hypothetical protein
MSSFVPSYYQLSRRTLRQLTGWLHIARVLIPKQAKNLRQGETYDRNSLIALPTPGFEVHQDDIIDMMGFKFRILDINHLHKHHILELVVRGEQ